MIRFILGLIVGVIATIVWTASAESDTYSAVSRYEDGHVLIQRMTSHRECEEFSEKVGGRPKCFRKKDFGNIEFNLNQLAK